MLKNNLPAISNLLTDLLVSSSSLYSIEKEKNGFPPYNILDIGDLTYRIDVGLSGFTRNDIEVTRENNTLFIQSNGVKEEENVKYLYRKLARRGFKLEFFIGKNIEIVNSFLANGILSITLKKLIPEELKSQKIMIEDRSPQTYFNVNN